MTGEAIGSRVLKFGLVQDGKLIEQGILSGKDALTVGSDPTNTLSVADPIVPKKHRLIETSGNHFKVSVFKGLDCRITLDDKLMSLDELLEKGIAKKKGHYTEFNLSPSSKGKFQIGNTTILYQLIPPPPPPPMLKLPKDLRSGLLKGLDFVFIAILILSVIIHVIVVGVLNTMEVSDNLSSAEQMKFAKKLVTAAEVILVQEEINKDENKEEDKQNAKPKKGGGGAAVKDKGDGGEKGGVENKGLIALITKEGTGGGSIANIINQGLGDDLANAINKFGGVEVARAGNVGNIGKDRKGSGGKGAGGTVGVGDLGAVSGKGTVEGGQRVEQKVKANISGGGAGVTGKIDQASVYSVIRRRIGGVRYCYESQLKTNPSLAGKIRVSFTIGSTGSVTSCSVVSNSMGDVMVQECVARMVRRWQFPPPDEGVVTVGYTFIFSSGG